MWATTHAKNRAQRRAKTQNKPIPREEALVHEMSLLEGMLEVIEEKAREGGYQLVHGVVLEVGRLASVEVEALRFAFEVVTKGTLAEGANLEVEEPPGLAWCGECDCEVPIQSRFDPCPHCNEGPLRITEGTAIRLKALDVE